MAILNEAGLNNIYKKTQNYATGAFTAFRGDKTRKENRANNKEALAYLLGKGYSVIKVKGSYIENFGSDTEKEVGEESFFVANTNVEGDDKGQLEKDLVKLGQAFDQDSILSVPHGQNGYLIGTSDREDGWPSKGQKEVVGKPTFGDPQGQFFSRTKGRKFAFESAEELKVPDTINGKWAMSKASERLEAEIARLKKLSGIG